MGMHCSVVERLVDACETGAKYIEKNRTHDQMFAYLSFAVVLTIGAQTLSDMVFSSIISLSASFQLLGFLLIVMKVRKPVGFSGSSVRSMQLFAIALAMRLFTTTQYRGYLPVDSTGEGTYQGIEMCSLITLIGLIAWYYENRRRNPFLDSEAEERESFSPFLSGIMVVGCCLLARFSHASLTTTSGWIRCGCPL